MADFSFSVGIEEYPMNGSALRVNMADNNLYYRILGMQDKLLDLEREYVEKAKGFDGKLDVKGFPTKPGEDGPGGVDISALSDEQYDAITARTEAMVSLNYDIDQRVKSVLRDVFGEDNDFDAIFRGVNVMALDRSGNRILANFMEAIAPIIEDAQKIKAKEVDDLVGNRAQRRARNRRAESANAV